MRTLLTRRCALPRDAMHIVWAIALLIGFIAGSIRYGNPS
jgi:hypothetical protein